MTIESSTRAKHEADRLSLAFPSRASRSSNLHLSQLSMIKCMDEPIRRQSNGRSVGRRHEFRRAASFQTLRWLQLSTHSRWSHIHLSVFSTRRPQHLNSNCHSFSRHYVAQFRRRQWNLAAAHRRYKDPSVAGTVGRRAEELTTSV